MIMLPTKHATPPKGGDNLFTPAASEMDEVLPGIKIIFPRQSPVRSGRNGVLCVRESYYKHKIRHGGRRRGWVLVGSQEKRRTGK